MLRKIILCFFTSFLFSVLLGLLLQFINYTISYLDWIWESKLCSFIFAYNHFTLFILVVCVPAGGTLGIYLIDKLVLKSFAYSTKKILICFGTAFLASAFLMLIRIYFETSTSKVAYFIKGDMYIVIILIVSALITTLGYIIK